MSLLQPVLSYFQPRPNAPYNRTLLFLVLSLVAIGLVMVASASVADAVAYLKDPYGFSKKHAIFVGIGLLLAAVVVRIEIDFWQKYYKAIMMMSLVSLVVVLVIGVEVNGSTRWIRLPMFNIQPSEFAKLAMLIFMSGYLVNQYHQMDQLKGFAKPAVIMIAFAGLLLMQPDLGSTVVVAACAMALLWIGGAHLMIYALMGILAVFGAVLLVILSPYRWKRVTSFLDPFSDPLGSGYQLTNSLMAFGRGGLAGEGLGNSVQKMEYLPEAHTDFIMAVVGEELGYIGVCLILVIMLVIVLIALDIGRKALLNKLPFHGYLASGIGVLFCIQTFVNVGAASGLIPTKGLTFPFLSYGGSSFMMSTIAAALLLRIDFELRRSLSEPVKAVGRRKLKAKPVIKKSADSSAGLGSNS